MKQTLSLLPKHHLCYPNIGLVSLNSIPAQNQKCLSFLCNSAFVAPKTSWNSIFTLLLMHSQKYIIYRWNYGNAYCGNFPVWWNINITFGRCKHADTYFLCDNLSIKMWPDSCSLSEGCGLCNYVSHLVVNWTLVKLWCMPINLQWVPRYIFYSICRLLRFESTFLTCMPNMHEESCVLWVTTLSFITHVVHPI